MTSMITTVLLSCLLAHPSSFVYLDGAMTVLGQPAPVFFVDQELGVQLRFPLGAATINRYKELGEWQLYRAGERVSLPPPKLSEPPTSHSEHLSFGRLPVGDYELWYVRPGVPTDRMKFGVRDGTESKELVIEQLWRGVSRTRSWHEAKALLMQLRELLPGDASVLYTLGLRSLDNVPPEETLAIFQQAHQIGLWQLERQEEERGRKFTPQELEEMGVLEGSTVFEQVFDFYKKHQHELKIVASGMGHSHGLVWVRRSDGKVLGFVDPTKENMVAPYTIGRVIQ